MAVAIWAGCITCDRSEIDFDKLNLSSQIKEVNPMTYDPDQYYADTLLNFSDGGKGAILGAYGGVDVDRFTTILNRVPVQPNVILGSNFGTKTDALLLPQDSSVTVGFSNSRILNGVGDDFRIEGLLTSQASADVYVSSKLSSNPNDFVYLGRTDGFGFNSFDLSAIGFNDSVQSVRLVGLAGSNIPEFSVTSIEALQAQLADGGLRLQGSDRADRLVGSNAADDLDGNGGNDKLFGIGGDDFLFGYRGNDLLVGDAGDDLLSGGEGNDILRGGKGDDYLSGGKGNNTIFCGSGRDAIALTTGRGFDRVRDFSNGQDKLFLPEKLKFGSLTITQTGKDTTIRSGSDPLATLVGIRANQITAADVLSS